MDHEEEKMNLFNLKSAVKKNLGNFDFMII